MTPRMPPYVVRCGETGCPHTAVYKIAARWSDGPTTELKTYALCCSDHLRDAFARSRRRQTECRLARGETLDPPSVFLLARDRRDRELQHCAELERGLLAESGA